jgi:hypothetical protein
MTVRSEATRKHRGLLLRALVAALALGAWACGGSDGGPDHLSWDRGSWDSAIWQ